VVQPVVQPVVGAVEESSAPVLDTANETLQPVTQPVGETLGPVVQPVGETLGGLTEPAGETVGPVLGSAAAGTVPQIVSPALEPAGTSSPAPPLSGALPAAGTSSPPEPAMAAFGAPRGGSSADSLAAIGLPSSSGQHGVAANAASSSAWERAGAFAVGTLNALIAAARELWAETLGMPLGMLFSGGLSGTPDGGGWAPLPAGGPAGAPSSAGSSSSGSGASAAGGLSLGVLALLFALSPLGGRLLRYPLDFPRPNSALVLVTERPG
jgi:hypothetical protein